MIYILQLRLYTFARSSYNQENNDFKELLHAVYITRHFKIHMN